MEKIRPAGLWSRPLSRSLAILDVLTVETLGDVRTLNQFDDALRRPGQFKTSAGERRGAVAN